MVKQKKSVLHDHKRIKKRLVPPLLAAMGDHYTSYSWAREVVPELIWIAILHQTMGNKEGVKFAVELALGADGLCTADPKPLFSKLSSYGVLSRYQKGKLKAAVSDTDHSTEARKSLDQLVTLVSRSPLHFLRQKPSSKKRKKIPAEVLNLLPKLYDRYSREAVLALATAIYIGVQQNKLIMAGDQAENLAAKLRKDFAEIESYPDTDASQAAGSSFRAMAPMLLLNSGGNKDQLAAKWRENFWNQIGQVGHCQLPVDLELEVVPEEDPERLLVVFRNNAKQELLERVNLWRFNLDRIEVHEVVCALLSRQVTIAIDLAAAPAIWTPHMAPIILRAMADVFITMSWIFRKPLERSRKFIEDGLGAIKLEIAHRKVEYNKTRKKDKRVKAIVDHWEKWLDSQRNQDLLEVNLGSWSGISTRKMAEEAGCLDFYNYVYQPFSHAVHSSWPHVSEKNSAYCLNPAHRFHRVAINVTLQPDLHWLVLAARYLQKTFDLFDKKSGVVVKSPSAYKMLLKNLQ